MDALTAPQQQAIGAPAPTADDTRTTLNSDYETFLRMLTVQMKNQDPLNPVDSAEFSLQLATFSALEQQVLTNDLLKSLVADMGAGSLQGLSSLLGQQVLAGERARFDGTPLSLRPTFDTEADTATLVVYTPEGGVVQRRKISVSERALNWDGTLDGGGTIPPGLYDFRVESYRGTEFLSVGPARSYATVTEARKSEAGVVLTLDNGAEVTADEIEAIRQAP